MSVAQNHAEAEAETIGGAIELEDARKAYQRLARNSAAELAQLREENARLKRELQEWRDYFT